MKFLRLIYMLAFVGLFTQACKTSKTGSTNETGSATQLSIFQNNKEHRIKKYSETAELDKKEFSLRFYNKKYDVENNKFYSAQIAAFMDKSEFDKVKIGLEMAELSCFEPGTGMAPARSGIYESLILTNTGHHYTFYENEESKRLNLLDDSGDLVKLEFEINSLYYDGKKVSMTETDLSEFYIAFLIDKNLNGIIDQGELNKLTIKLK
ncbi:hypothetical protein [Fulvivirga sediminis]|uniref:EF-hand domain-containing protein n=1 Tax=Fulvivirga sediminis TaxID=2803949 RepID=A0A937FBA0_9BACT|nr:hypothetical protein [Fulvivirga sediminis]MBL3658801.1 hypothetical protein [Fulvivirga sediminis]